MNELQMTSLLSEILDCGVADINILKDTKYDWSDIIDRAKEYSDGSLTLDVLFYSIVNIGLDELESAVESKIRDLDEEDERDKEELEALQSLNVREDFNTYFNYLDTHVSYRNNQEVYQEYLASETELFEDSTGFNIE